MRVSRVGLLVALGALVVASALVLFSATSGRAQLDHRAVTEAPRARARSDDSEPRAALASDLRPPLPGASRELPWRGRLRLARETRCARATPGIPVACERVRAGQPTQNLTQPLVLSVAGEQPMIFVAFANAKYGDFATSWIANLARANVTQLLIGAMDAPALRLFDGLDVASFLMGTPRALLLNGQSPGGPTEYLKLGSFKTALVSEIIGFGVDVVLSDVDNLIVRDPRPFFARYPEADVLATADLLSTTVTSGGLELGKSARDASLNVGLLLLRVRAKALVEEWAQHMVEHPTHWDQAVFDQMAKRRAPDSSSPQPKLRRSGQLWECYQGRLWCGVLPVSSFCGGHQYHAEQLPHKLGLEPYAVHTTFINSMDQGKRHRLREAAIFEDPPEYYSPGGGVLTYQPDIPARLYTPRAFSLRGGRARPQFTVAEHFALVHHQLRQLRDALALANATGRVLVLPRFVCALDRFFYRHDGVSPGSSLHLPLWNCPADMVLALQLGVKPSPELFLREHSFLANPRTPRAMSAPEAALEVALEPEDGASAPTRQAVLSAISSPRARAARVLRLTGALPDAQGWLSADEYRSFEASVRNWADFWCCAPLEESLTAEMLAHVQTVHPELPLKAKTHVYYDLFADKVPHTDKVGRVWTTPWRPIPGEKWNLTDAMSEPWRSMVVFGTRPKVTAK